MKNICILLITLFISKFYCQTNADKVREHLTKITKTEKYRNYQNLSALNEVGNYIKSEFSNYSKNVKYQEYTIDGKIYKNVICEFGTEHAETLVIGAHYDVYGNQEGADDNASGVVGLLELARQLKNQNLNKKIQLVAYTLEEPPYFRTENMGSYIHAKSLKEKNVNVIGMISLEMIGYFKDDKNSQKYPLKFLSWFYGNKGDYITLVNKFSKKKFARRFTKKFREINLVKSKKFTGPKFLQGIDFSDHLNYWKSGYSALMITDTSFYRNRNYHEKTDEMSGLDINRMCKVIDNVYETIIRI